MPKPQPDPLINSDLADLREKLGLTLLDFQYAIGRSLGPMSLPRKKSDAVTNTPLGYMVRLLNEEPTLISVLFPRWPTHEDAYQAVAGVWNKDKYGRLSERKFALICGVKMWTYTRWKAGAATPTLSTARLFHYLCEIIRRKGGDGLEMYLQLVDKDARSRGMAGGLGELFRSTKSAESVESLPAEPVTGQGDGEL